MASKHLVICVQCGKQFDANNGGYYNQKSRRYTCKACAKAQKTAIRTQQTGMKQSIGAMIAKIAIGALFVIAGFSNSEGDWSFGYFLTAMIIGGALISWGLLPYLKVQKEKKQQELNHKAAIEMQYNTAKTCQSCDATGTGDICEYCGTKYS